MLSTTEIIDTIKSGKTVISCGNRVIAENITYDWETPELRIQLKNGGSYPLEGNEFRAVKIHNYGLEGEDYIVFGNGSKWAGSPEDPIELLLERLEKHALEPRWAKDGVKKTIACIADKCNENELSFDGHYNYLGNFYDVSAGFNIWVKRNSHIEQVLDALIDKNLSSDAYKSALQEHLKSIKD